MSIKRKVLLLIEHLTLLKQQGVELINYEDSSLDLLKEKAAPTLYLISNSKDIEDWWSFLKPKVKYRIKRLQFDPNNLGLIFSEWNKDKPKIALFLDRNLAYWFGGNDHARFVFGNSTCWYTPIADIYRLVPEESVKTQLVIEINNFF